MEFPKPQKEHEWLQRLVGEWTFEADCSTGPDQPAEKSKGVWRVRSLGGFWIVADGEGTSPDGQTHHSILTIGFDTSTNRFVGSFIASMMSKFWVYDGALEGDDKLVLAATGPDFTGQGEGETLYHDIVELQGEGRFRFYSRVQGADGVWNEFMNADYRRAA